MAIPPTIYAKALIEALQEGKSAKKIAKNFWELLQKKKQYKILPAILDKLDEVYAEEKKRQLIKVYSDQNLQVGQKKEVRKKLESRFGKNITVKYSLKPNITGIIIKTSDTLIDFSLTNKINQLRKHISF